MAVSVNPATATMIFPLKDEDFFTKFGMKKLKVLGEGMSGKIYLVQHKNGSGRLIAVKEFSFLGNLGDRNLRLFKIEARVMQVRDFSLCSVRILRTSVIM